MTCLSQMYWMFTFLDLCLIGWIGEHVLGDLRTLTWLWPFHKFMHWVIFKVWRKSAISVLNSKLLSFSSGLWFIRESLSGRTYIICTKFQDNLSHFRDMEKEVSSALSLDLWPFDLWPSWQKKKSQRISIGLYMHTSSLKKIILLALHKYMDNSIALDLWPNEPQIP